MPTWDSVSPEDQLAVQDNIINPLRSAMILLSRLTAMGSSITAAWTGGLSSHVNNLSTGEIIPSTSGLAGAQGLTKEDIASMVQCLINISDTAKEPNSPSMQALRVKACGVNSSLTQ